MKNSYEKSMKIVDEVISSIPKKIKNDKMYKLIYVYLKVGMMIDLVDDQNELSKDNLHISDNEVTNSALVEQASDFRCLSLGKALCKGYADVLNMILNRLGIETIKVSSEDHTWNQVLIDGVWYNCDLSSDYESTRNHDECSNFLKSDNDFLIKSKGTAHECSSTYDSWEQLSKISYVKSIIKEENYIKMLNDVKEKLQAKISTNNLYVACTVHNITHIIEPYAQYESFGKEHHQIIVDPRRKLVFKHKTEDQEIYLDTTTIEPIVPKDIPSSYYSTSSAFGTVYGYSLSDYSFGGPLTKMYERQISKDFNQYGYLMPFREYIKKIIGVDLSYVTLTQAKVLLKIANLMSAKAFELSVSDTIARTQLDEKVYLRKSKN